MRLLIISNETGEDIATHNIDRAQRELLKECPYSPHTLETSIFDRVRGYSLFIDYGSLEPENQIKNPDWNIVLSYIEKHVQDKEYAFFHAFMDNQ
jgi:SAM-dependent MidA family methyltransferase